MVSEGVATGMEWDGAVREGLKGKYRVGILALLGGVCIGLEIGVHLFLRTAVGYTHIFYVLLVLSALWYYRRALLVAGGLVVATFATSLVVGDLSWATFLRAAMFLVVTWVVGVISEERDRAKAEVEAQKEAVEKKHFALVGYISEAALRLKNPLEVLRDNLVSIRSQLDNSPDIGELKIMLSVQVTHLEQVLENFRALNKEIVEEREEIPQAYREFLTR